jgi:hypothetical protein
MIFPQSWAIDDDLFLDYLSYTSNEISVNFGNDIYQRRSEYITGILAYISYFMSKLPFGDISQFSVTAFVSFKY